MDICETKASVGWPQLPVELKLEILWHLLDVDVEKEEQEVTPVSYNGISKSDRERNAIDLEADMIKT